MNNSIFEIVESSSDTSESSEEEEIHFKQTRFMNMTTYEEYEKNRNFLYTKDLVRKRILIDSHNYYQSQSDFNTSNFIVDFDFQSNVLNNTSSQITTNYSSYPNVIGFRLIRSTIRTPPFNVNTTNNIIKYKKKGGDGTIYTITINPGIYNMNNLSSVFQKYQGSSKIKDGTRITETINTLNDTDFVTYDDTNVRGYSIHQSCRFAPLFTQDINKTLVYLDGSDNDSPLQDGDRVLLRSQWSSGDGGEDAVKNGIYRYNSSSMMLERVPSPDPAAQGQVLHPGTIIYITEGSQAGKSFILDEDKMNLSVPVFVGQTGLEFKVFSSQDSHGALERNTFNFRYIGETSTSIPRETGIKSNIFEITYNGDEGDEIIFLWDYNNFTRGAARLFGFLPKVTETTNQKLYSDRSPDVSTHFVDLVIPEIPSISCKKNSSGKEVIERIQLKAGHGAYLHYNVGLEESKIQNFFSPISLHRLSIQLYSVNNVLYDSNNSDVSFEFEITMVKNKKLLT
tara:strand:- start:1097 stop:2623 length:1527 start_codon:yes stop_codon:yes gene_type:complete